MPRCSRACPASGTRRSAPRWSRSCGPRDYRPMTCCCGSRPSRRPSASPPRRETGRESGWPTHSARTSSSSSNAWCACCSPSAPWPRRGRPSCSRRRRIRPISRKAPRSGQSEPTGRPVIQIEGAAKSYGGRALFHDLSWRLAPGERVGLVGPNGAGKTTLCRALAGLEELDEGQVTRARDATIGYLPQEAAGAAMGSVLAEALSGFAEVWAIEREMHEVARALIAAADDALTARYGDLQHRFEALGGYRLESEAKAILEGLGFAGSDLLRPLAEFSGGWRMRAALARLLLLRPYLLLLDEPTNHLDLASLAWLEAFLATYEGAVVVVSHDRYFLNRMVNSIAELGSEGLTIYPGDYDDFLVEREARRELAEARARNQAKQVAEVERFIERFRYKATKARQVQSRIKMLERLERVEVGEVAREIRFSFPAPPRTGRHVVQLRGIVKAYGPKVVYAGVDLDIERGDRIALVGPNGAGKSTLLRIVAGVLPA